MQPPRNAIGPYLRIARKAEKPAATQADISARLETEGVFLGARAIGLIEQGLRPVTDLQLIAFAKVLRVSPLWLLGLSDKMR